jgi:uncharacterized protein YecE (DUF72 family)
MTAPAAPPAPTAEELVRLRAAIPPGVRFGSSSWNYPGWKGLVYTRDYGPKGAPAAMLEEYARWPLFGTVGVDSSFYGPLTPAQYRRYAQALPPEFPAVTKVWDRVTVHTFARAREPSRAGERNPDFLNPQLFVEEVWGPSQAHFAGHQGPFVFEFQAIAREDRVSPEDFAGMLDRFFERLPPDGRYAVEVRNPEFLTPVYFAVLRAHEVAHVFTSWTRMPAMGVQLDLPGAVTARFLVARALLRPGRAYAEAVDAFAPYDRIREPNPELRSDLVRLAETAARLRIPAYLLVNNRAEGSAPHTIIEVVRRLAERRGETGAGPASGS